MESGGVGWRGEEWDGEGRGGMEREEVEWGSRGGMGRKGEEGGKGKRFMVWWS